jgi:hypothetical protein
MQLPRGICGRNFELDADVPAPICSENWALTLHFGVLSTYLRGAPHPIYDIDMIDDDRFSQPFILLTLDPDDHHNRVAATLLSTS